MTKVETEAKTAKKKQRKADTEAAKAKAAKRIVKKELIDQKSFSKALLEKIPSGKSHNDASPPAPYPWLKPVFGSAFALCICSFLGMIYKACKAFNVASNFLDHFSDLLEHCRRLRREYCGDSSSDDEDPPETPVVHDSSARTVGRVPWGHRHSAETVAATGGG